ncbi:MULTISPECIES: trans-sulfuration enzyme family protein [Ruminococcus]|uniref:Cystathionine beta-lyase n=1 Tax=Ruminococcus albus 8 TaxID=246199 RepID=E9SF59_RUMAL|nr:MULTISPECIES: PLP-dependent aspartate aminotransferase family protein [Ruminococcus]EGC02070.1 cystathionine beta-lyase [Ruminococcus albus 8]MBE6873260.1 PLP-dependent transferase [Ruminococcus albus]MBQ9541010.1 PLP-dependent transferase [Ruminococcus sp.]MCC3350852.1 PLP-dependent aspartate aminotransferase family protein [Ruminococcus albus 8]
MSYNNIETALIHGGISIDERTGAVNVPIYQTSTFKQDGLGKMRGYEYSRTGNPTREALEALIAELEGGYAGFAFASGLAAETAVLSLLHTGDRVLISSNVYGGTFRLLNQVFDHFGINYTISDTEDPAAFEKDITDDVKAVLIESPANPLMTITDIRAVADIAHRHGLLVIVDNTFMTPYLQRPIELGADIVVHSATKYLGGHSDVVAGLAVVKTKELAEKLAFIQNSTGGVLPPFDSFLLIRGIKTLGVRLDRHVENAVAAAEYLSANEAVKSVHYPGLPTDKGYEVNKRQAKNGGVMISFELTEGHDIEKFFESLELITLAESLGGVESLVCHPSTMTHASIPEEIRKKVGITDGLIRLSIGIENISDILADLEKAIKASEVK